ncbi:hypothetical protein B0H13DRAFT_1883920 [Mycena leptocephala]|nr:hypothetical protein B0H13DRAFT_1883920 [Mycena leptocephala]
MSVPARTSSERRAAARNRAVGRMGCFRSREEEGKEPRHGGGAGLPAGVDGSHAVEVEAEVGVEVGVGVEEEEEGEPRSSPRQIRPSAGTAYAGAYSAGGVCAAARAAVNVESAGSPERGDLSNYYKGQREGTHELRTRRHRIRQRIEQRVRGGLIEVGPRAFAGRERAGPVGSSALGLECVYQTHKEWGARSVWRRAVDWCGVRRTRLRQKSGRAMWWQARETGCGAVSCLLFATIIT